MAPKLTDILKHAKKFSPNIMLQMPKNTNIYNLLKITNRCNIGSVLSIEKILTNDNPSQLFIYFGEEKFTGLNNSRLYTQIYSDLEANDKKTKAAVRKKLR